MDEDFNHLVMECNNCGLQFYASQLRTNPMTNSLMCVNCLQAPGSKLNVIKDRPLAKKPHTIPIIKQALPTQKKGPQAPEGYAFFECTHCSYVFKRKDDFNGICPYCSKQTVRRKRD